MTDEVSLRQAEIQARAQAATKGPWWNGPHYTCDVDSRLGNIRNQSLYTEQGRADADFIAHARQDIPWLLQRLAQVEQETADVRRVSLNHIKQTNALMTWLRAALNGEELNDVALSFALVREVADIKAALAAARQEMAELEARWRKTGKAGGWDTDIAFRQCADDLAAARLRASHEKD